MLLKSEIEDVFHAQQKALKKELLTSRNYLVENTFKGKQVEVISGIRRSGKSTLMRMIMAHYAPNVICFNFEDSRIFGFEVSEVNGHDVSDLANQLKKQPQINGKPKAIIAHTIKGKGIISAETSSAWHHKAKITKEEIIILRRELQAS